MMKDYQEPMVNVLTLNVFEVLTLSEEDKADGDLDWE